MRLINLTDKNIVLFTSPNIVLKKAEDNDMPYCIFNNSNFKNVDFINNLHIKDGLDFSNFNQIMILNLPEYDESWDGKYIVDEIIIILLKVFNKRKTDDLCFISTDQGLNKLVSVDNDFSVELI